jgi:hypothetical protein
MPGPLPRPFSRIEQGTRTFTGGTGTLNVTFSQAFDSVPVVVITDQDSDSSTNVTIVITAVSKSGFSVEQSSVTDDQYLKYTAIG